MKTNAVRLLDAAGIAYELREYDVDPNDLSAETVARKIGMPAEQVFKTLVLRGDASAFSGTARISAGTLELTSAGAAGSGTILFDAEALSEIEGVVVAVPGEDAAFAESLREFRGMMPLDPDSKGRAALRNACGVADPV